MKVVALLPMKGHSERVPDKNLKLFNGRPLFHIILEKLLQSAFISKVVINTDSEKIAGSALNNFSRVEIIDRPAELIGDMVPMNEIIRYDLSVTNDEHFIQTHSTNPLLKTDTIDRAIAFYFDHLEQYDSVFSVTRLQTRLYWKDGSPVNHDPALLLRTQDLPPIFEENSNFFIFSKTSFSNADNRRIGNTPFMFVMDKLEATDIDEPVDFILAELIHSQDHR